MAATLFQRAFPLPKPGPASGSTSSAGTTLAPAAVATAPVRSVELPSTTSKSSTSPAAGGISVRRTSAQIAPTVDSSFRAGRQTAMVRFPLRSASRPAVDAGDTAGTITVPGGPAAPR